MHADSENADATHQPGVFEATQWSEVLRARDKSEVALNNLCQNYRRPLIIWLRLRGSSPHDAEDLVQGLFARLLSRDFLSNVSPEKGRFRTFMLRCLKNYMADQHAKNVSGKRGSGASPESLDATFDGNDRVHDPADPNSTPDLAFDRAWAAAVLANAIRRLHEECARQGHAALSIEMEPVLFHDDTASGYREIGIRLGMTEAAVKMAASRTRARLRGLVQDEVLQTVHSKKDQQSELEYLMQLSGK